MIGSLKVIQEGIFTTIQDEGRFGFRKYGIPQSGVMDIQALHFANYLVNNPLDNPAFEFTLKGGKYQFDSDAVIALTGAEMEPTINNFPSPQYQSIKVNKGDVLELRFAKDGMRSYLALHGSLRVPQIMDSYSTYTLAGIGGFNGRTMKAGDIIHWASEGLPKNYFRKIPEHVIPKNSEEVKIIRIIEGPETGSIKGNFKDMEAIIYQVSPESNRMGIKIKGEELSVAQYNIASSATVPGTIQLPDGGNPIVLMKDGQTTGGYPRIGKVIDADLAKMAQLRPGDQMHFKFVELSEAKELWKYHFRVMAALQKSD